MMNVQILQSTFFHYKDQVITFDLFKQTYGSQAPHATTIGDFIRLVQENAKWKEWFKFVLVDEHPMSNGDPLEVILDGKLYVKDFSGAYFVYNPNDEIDPLKAERQISIPELRDKLRDVKFAKMVWYCTNDVKKKL